MPSRRTHPCCPWLRMFFIQILEDLTPLHYSGFSPNVTPSVIFLSWLPKSLSTPVLKFFFLFYTEPVSLPKLSCSLPFEKKKIEYKFEEESNLILFLTLIPAPQNGQWIVFNKRTNDQIKPRDTVKQFLLLKHLTVHIHESFWVGSTT